jgi:transcriptional repressor NrdR
MKCPFCAHPENRVVDSREGPDGLTVRRRRECEGCRRRFTTHERCEEFVPSVVKKDGRREEFQRSKLIEGLVRACEKRPVAREDLETFVDGLLARIQDQMLREVESRWLGEQVMDFLRTRDQVAYVRFASVYRRFTDLSEFDAEIRALLADRGRGIPG